MTNNDFELLIRLDGSLSQAERKSRHLAYAASGRVRRRGADKAFAEWFGTLTPTNAATASRHSKCCFAWNISEIRVEGEVHK
ncbi:hypothetical protein [Phyllobacterium zundukense]|uniref:hypothetical protein n=1 Tax=Phyllobacterium zundukense TaxID=1867719 RepID=UPI0010559D62|nr:hypothetical protein [Phyllobacterium zundukense]